MKNYIFTLCGFLFFSISIYGQQGLAPEGKKIKDGVIYLTFDGKNLEYFSPNNSADSRKSVNEAMKFSLKNDNSCNIYMKWINPLKYKITWKDSTYVDEREKAINDFVTLLVAQFGSPVSSLNNNESSSLIAKSQKPTLRVGSTELFIPENGFNNTDLTFLYMHLRANQNVLTDEERKNLSSITKDISELDKKIAVNISKNIDNMFIELFSLSDPTMVRNVVDMKINELNKFNDTHLEVNKLQNIILKSLSEITLKDKLLNSYTKTVISNFINHTITINNSNKVLIDKLIPIIDQMNSSINIDEVSSNSATKDFYRIRNISFEDGQQLKTDLILTEYEYKKDTKEIIKKDNILNKSITFQKYDFFSVSVSTGIFYSSTTLKGFGVSNSPDGQFIVTEDNITENNPITAVFLNFNFGIGSRYFAPLTQIGIDPTQRRPFILLGGGFSIPSARISFTSGPLWTWSPTLNNLTVGNTITSTTQLDQDIQYNFELKPKGWYLGIQYNF